MQQLAPEPATAPPTHPAAPELTAGLRQLVRQNGRRWKLVLAVEAVSLAVAAPLAYLWLVFFLDNMLHLPAPGRLLAAAGFVGGLVWAVRLLVRLQPDGAVAALLRYLPYVADEELEEEVWFGLDAEGRVTLADEIHTPDSSRYWLQVSYERRFAAGAPPESFDKDVIRNWILARCNPYEDPIPEISRKMRLHTAAVYVSAFETITGESFAWPDAGIAPLDRIREALRIYLA